MGQDNATGGHGGAEKPLLFLRQEPKDVQKQFSCSESSRKESETNRKYLDLISEVCYDVSEQEG